MAINLFASFVSSCIEAGSPLLALDSATKEIKPRPSGKMVASRSEIR